MPAFNYCPGCGSPLTIDRSNPFAEQKCFCCGASHYHNSKPTAGALIVDSGRILLSQRAREPFRGDWDIPGGFLELLLLIVVDVPALALRKSVHKKRTATTPEKDDDPVTL